MRLDNFINRPVLSTVISILVVILGIIGLVSLPIEQYPDIAPPTIVVRAYYPGADAQTVQNSVLAPLEEQINGVEGMTYMTSSATNDGSASVTIYFEQGSNADMAQVNVQNRVSQASALLPAEVTQGGVTVQKRQTSNVLIMALTSDGRYDEKFLSNYADINIIPEMKRIDGIGDCESIGLKTYTMRLWLDPVKMHDLKLIPSDVVTALAEQNIEAAPGKFGEQSTRQYEYSMKYTGRLKTPEEFGNMIIKTDDMGRVLRVRDVAKVEMGALYYTIQSQMNSHPGVVMMVSQRAGSNATRLANDVKKTAERLSKSFPPGMEIRYVMDVTEFIYASQHEVIKTLFEALVLVFIVVFIFLQDFRSTIIPMIAVPVSLVGTMFFLNVIGFSINLLTLSALVLAIAIVVDDAIVVVEAVHAKLDMGYKSARKASIDAMNEISGAIISITLVMSAVFVPVSFMSGTTGTFYREFGLTMAMSIIISAVNALTLSPALCAILLKPHGEEGEHKQGFKERFFTGFNTSYNKLQDKYQNAVSAIVHKPVIALVAVLIGIAALVGSAMFTKSGLVPDEDTGTVFVTVSTPPGTSLAKTDSVMNQVQRMLGNNPAVENAMRVTGYNLIAGQGSNQGTFFVSLKPFDERSRSEYSTMVLGMIYKQTAVIKGAQILAFQPPMVSGFSATNSMTFAMQDRTGGSLDKFFGITKDFIAALNKRPEFSNVMTAFNSSYPQYMIDVDVAKCKQSGISPKTVLSTMQGYYGGLYSSNFNSYGKLYRVYVQGDPKAREDKTSLQSIYVRTPDGDMAPVSEFVNLRKVYGPQVIERFNLFTSINVNATPSEGYSTGDCIKAIEEVSADVLPAGYTYEYSGLTRNEAESSSSTAIILALCLVFVYLILSAQYESYLLPLSVILSIPFGLAGAFLFTNLFGKNNDIYMQIALIMLVGLLAKNAILIVQFALERRRLGMAISWSAILGSAARLRPILMTALAMIIGLFPLIITGIPGLSLFMPPAVGENGYITLGAAAIGGMLVGTFCQILVVPALFVIFQYLQERFTPLQFEDELNSAVEAELAQYTMPKDKHISEIKGNYVK